MARLAGLFFASVLGFVGCRPSPAPPRVTRDPAVVASPTHGGGPERPVAAPREGTIEPGRLEVFDERSDGARIVGMIEPPPPDADPERVFVMDIVSSAGSIANSFDTSLQGTRTLDARFVANGVATIGTDHVLRFHAAGQATVLDRHAYGPMSVAGTRIAYARGEAPDLEIARADAATRTVTPLTRGLAPAYSPAFTPDGNAVVFVSASLGSPRFHRVDGEGQPRALAPTERTPGSPIAPHFDGTLLVFEDESGVAWADLDQGRIVRSVPVAR